MPGRNTLKIPSQIRPSGWSIKICWIEHGRLLQSRETMLWSGRQTWISWKYVTRNNAKIIGLNEDTNNEKTWEDTEELVITTIKEKLDIDGVKSERAHRVGKPRPSHRTNPDGSTMKVPPRPVIARLSFWKQKEAILKATREVKPKKIRFYQDLSTRTLERRAQKIPDLIAERKRDNTAYLVLDKLVAKRSKDRDKTNENS